MKMGKKLYSVGTWDMDKECFTLQEGLSIKAINIPLNKLKIVMRELRNLSYDVTRRRQNSDYQGDYYYGDPSVLIIRTDGDAEEKILTVDFC